MNRSSTKKYIYHPHLRIIQRHEPPNCSFFHSVLICNLLGKDCANHHRSRRPMFGEKAQSASIRTNVHIDDDLASRRPFPNISGN